MSVLRRTLLSLLDHKTDHKTTVIPGDTGEYRRDIRACSPARFLVMSWIMGHAAIRHDTNDVGLLIHWFRVRIPGGPPVKSHEIKPRATIAAWRLSCKPNGGSAFVAIFDDHGFGVTTIS